MLQTIIKLILSALFLICLFKMPYGYFQIVRFAGLIGFLILSYFAFKEARMVETIIFISLALLFQPLIKVAMGRTIWNLIDIFVSIGLLSSIFLNRLKK
mgnify:CR=1 FL=1